MKLLVNLILVLTCSGPLAYADWNGKIINVGEKKEVSRAELIEKLSLGNVIVIGEKHYTKEVQAEEGRIISEVVTFAKKQNQFSTSWEFLNASSQQTTQALFNQVVNFEISSTEFLEKTQGFAKASLYAPIIDSTATLGGQLFGVNLSREEKAPVVERGINALDPKLLPPDFKFGGSNYLERFNEVMKDHATPEQISNYFAAQSLVDDIAAFHLKKDSKFDLKFLIIGAFHSLFNDGVVARIKERSRDSKVINVEVIDASDFTEKEIDFILVDQKYGGRSDYTVFINEPHDR